MPLAGALVLISSVPDIWQWISAGIKVIHCAGVLVIVVESLRIEGGKGIMNVRPQGVICSDSWKEG